MKKIIITILLLNASFIFSQKKEENIGTEVINVVKPYTPTVSDANKIKEIPSLDDKETNTKEIVKYQIFSFPVASTFTPSKGKAAGVEKAKQERLFPNYVTFGFGNYETANAELFVTHEIDKYQYVGAKLQHLSSQGGIKNVVLDNKFSQTAIDALYGYHRNDIKFTANLGYEREGYNWYGLPLENPIFSKSLINTVDPSHTFNTFKLGSELSMDKSFFNQLNLDFIAFSDNYGSRENRFIIKPDFSFDFGKTTVNTKFGLDYLNTSFESSYLNRLPEIGKSYAIEKSNLIFNVNPSFQLLKDDLSVEIGADVVFLSEGKETFAGIKSPESDNSLFIYPKVNASYKIVGDLMIGFAGIEGKLIQNSYENFTRTNPFLSPTLYIEPTDQQYDVSGGLRGKLSSSLSYNVKGAYNSSRNQALFKSNPYLLTPVNNYSYGNSFEVVYDAMKTMSFFGELKSDINKNIALGINAEVHSYNTDLQSEAWNLPTLKATFTTDFNVGKKWYAGTQLFYVGERKDEFTTKGFSQNYNAIQTLEGYFDINAHIGYKHNERLTAFIKGSNLANQNYNRWLNMPVQGAQVILGASYKFDF